MFERKFIFFFLHNSVEESHSKQQNDIINICINIIYLIFYSRNRNIDLGCFIRV